MYPVSYLKCDIAQAHSLFTVRYYSLFYQYKLYFRTFLLKYKNTNLLNGDTIITNEIVIFAMTCLHHTKRHLYRTWPCKTIQSVLKDCKEKISHILYDLWSCRNFGQEILLYKLCNYAHCSYIMTRMIIVYYDIPSVSTQMSSRKKLLARILLLSYTCNTYMDYLRHIFCTLLVAMK